ncbi:hypothetical protein DRJ54_06245, partial [Candidatus Acetothermia bacterium]
MRKVALLGTLVMLLGVFGLAQVEPLGIIIEPPTEEGLSVRIWVEKPAYAVGEYVTIHFEVNQDAYVYIWDISPDGVCLIFPNQNEMNNYVTAGEHTVPGPGKGDYLRVVPPLGTEWLQIVATKQRVDGIVQFFGGFSPGSQFACSPAGRQAISQLDQVKSMIDSALPENERAFDFTSFEVVSGTPPAYGTLQVNTNPMFARLYVDGVFRGWTPRSLSLAQGFHDILIRKTGYQDYAARVYIMGGRTRTLNVTLTPLAVNQPPVAQFTYSPTNPQPGQWIQFDASASHDPDGTIASYQWDFDADGAFDTTGQLVYYRFMTAGSYPVTLRVTDDDGASNQVTQTIVVTSPNQPPVAQFAYSPTNPQPGQWIQFDASASYDPDGTIAGYQWDF